MDKIVEILDNAKAIRISMLDDIYPYIVPCRDYNSFGNQKKAFR